MKEEGRTLNPKSKQNQTGFFGPAALVVQFFLTVMFFFTDYSFTRETVFGSTTATMLYNGVALMLLVGFGYLRVFLKFYGLGAVGFTFFIVTLGLQWALLVEGWIAESSIYLSVDISSFLHAGLAVASALVAFGALVGKIGPLQVLVFTLAEIACYGANKAFFLNSKYLDGFSDVGGSIAVNVFGAYFGLAASFAYGAAEPWVDKDNGVTVGPEVGLSSSYFSDNLSLLGTLLIWVSAPSFVAASLPMDSATQRLAIMNTLFALLGSTVVVFGCTTLPNQRLHVAPIRNASLAGAVSIGAVAGFLVGPGGAILIGALGGVVSCFLFAYPFPHAIYDTANIHALHGIPGLFGGLVSAVLPFFLEVPTTLTTQILGTFGTLLLASFSGSLTGFLLKVLPRPLPPFHDDTFWDTEHLDGWPDGKDVKFAHLPSGRRRDDR